MATNVTEKDKTLNEIISYCKQKMNDISHDLDNIADNLDIIDDFYSKLQGQVDAYEGVALKCIHMLGYGGTMPLEVPNQAEDAK